MIDWGEWIGEPLLSYALHDSMHIYRIALLKTTQQELEDTVSSLPVSRAKNERNGGVCLNYRVETREHHRLQHPEIDLEMQNLETDQQDGREQGPGEKPARAGWI